MALIFPPAAAAAAASGSAPGTGNARGPVVVVPHCRIETTGCGLDPATPDLDPAACAAAIAKHLERRGVSAHLSGTVADVCAADPAAVVIQAAITAVCPGKRGGNTLLDFARKTLLQADIEMRNCATGEVAGRSRTERALESGRRTLLRDAMEEFSHHVSEREVRRTQPGTPLAWLRADVGGEHSIEVRGGAVDVEESQINDFFRAAGPEEDEYASRATLETAYHPWRAQRFRFALGLDRLEIRRTGEGTFAGALLNLNSPDPNIPLNFVGARVNARLRTLGLNGSAAYGLDITRHQRISLGVNGGYYLLGTSVARSVIQVEGLPPLRLELRAASWARGAEVRWDWRLTPHLAVNAAYGWNDLNFDNPDRTHSRRFLPFDVEFTGQAARAGIAGRF